MLKDRAQKASALRLCVSKRWLPYLEVEVQPEQSLEKSRSLLTDIDVLAIASSPIGQSTRLVFDCKSGGRESAIGRAFWLRGVMTRANVAHGFIVMNDKVTITRDHRTSAADLSVIPMVSSLTFIGKNLLDDEVSTLYFQDVESYRAGIRITDENPDPDSGWFETWPEASHSICEFENALELLMLCSLRRKGM